MITSLFFFFLYASSILETQCALIDKDTPLAMHCKEESKVTQEILESYANDPEKEPTEEYYCYLRCVFVGAGLLNEAGEIQIDFYKAKFSMGVECMKEIPNVVKCADVEAMLECAKNR